MMTKALIRKKVFKVEYHLTPRANGAEPGARVLIPPGYLHPGGNESISEV
jgi:hypothetical protein